MDLLDLTMPQAPPATCEGCGRIVSRLNDWKLAPKGGILHRACEVRAHA